MVRRIDIEKAKTQFARLGAAAGNGEEIVLTKDGVPKAKLVAVPEVPQSKKLGKRQAGQWAKYLTPEELAYRRSEQFQRDWKAMDAEIEDSFKVLREDTREFDTKWPDTSSTPTRSSTSRTVRKQSAKKRSKR